MAKNRYTSDSSEGTGKVWKSNDGWPTGAPRTYLPYFATGLDSLVYSEGHPYRELGKSDRKNIGGPFHVYHKHVVSEGSDAPTEVSTHGSNCNRVNYPHYSGPTFARKMNLGVNDYGYDLPITPGNELDVFGTMAIANVIPTNPLAGVAQFLGELKRDGTPNLVGSDYFYQRAGRAKAAGSEYLNVEFGWKPLVNDVRNLARSVVDSHELLRQYERASGTKVHRSFSMPGSSTTTTSSQTGNYYPSPALDFGFYESPGSNQIYSIQTTTKRMWFEGCFTYYLAPSNTRKGIEQRANYLLGTRLTPEVLYDLAPWTWAVDWVTDLGSIVSNVGSFLRDGLVMPYGYVMCEQTSRIYNSIRWRYSCQNGAWSTAYCTKEFVRKQRSMATPFGFGLNPATFTSRQWSILVALGLSKDGSTVAK